MSKPHNLYDVVKKISDGKIKPGKEEEIKVPEEKEIKKPKKKTKK